MKSEINSGSCNPSELMIAGSTGFGRPSISKQGIPTREPQYSIPKDTNQSFIAANIRKGKATPGPADHYQELTWKSVGGNFGGGFEKNKKGNGRQTFLDEAIQISKKGQTSPTRYNPQKSFKNDPKIAIE